MCGVPTNSAASQHASFHRRPLVKSARTIISMAHVGELQQACSIQVRQTIVFCFVGVRVSRNTALISKSTDRVGSVHPVRGLFRPRLGVLGAGIPIRNGPLSRSAYDGVSLVSVDWSSRNARPGYEAYGGCANRRPRETTIAGTVGIRPE